MPAVIPGIANNPLSPWKLERIKYEVLCLAQTTEAFTSRLFWLILSLAIAALLRQRNEGSHSFGGWGKWQPGGQDFLRRLNRSARRKGEHCSEGRALQLGSVCFCYVLAKLWYSVGNLFKSLKHLLLMMCWLFYRYIFRRCQWWQLCLLHEMKCNFESSCMREERENSSSILILIPQNSF